MHFTKRVAALLAVTLLAFVPAAHAWAVQATPTATQSPEPVSSLIVHYKAGFGPITAGGGLRGATKVTGAIRFQLRPGPALGFNMWRLDFAKPVSLATAQRVAAQLMSAPTVISAEPDAKVSAVAAR